MMDYNIRSSRLGAVGAETKTDFEMNSKIKDRQLVIDFLNDLISVNRGIKNVFEIAAERLEDETNKELLEDYVEQHEQFIIELSNAVNSLSGNPVTDRSASNLAKQAWITVKAAITEGDGPILAEAAEDIHTVLTVYQDAMEMDLPDNIRDLVRRHMSKIRLTHKKLSALGVVYDN